MLENVKLKFSDLVEKIKEGSGELFTKLGGSNTVSVIFILFILAALFVGFGTLFGFIVSAIYGALAAIFGFTPASITIFQGLVIWVAVLCLGRVFRRD